MSDIFDDLFANRDTSRANDPKYAAPDADTLTSWPTLSSKEQMASVFEAVVKQKFPTAAEMARFRTTGKHIDPVTKEVRPGHRTRTEFGARPLDGFVGQVKEAQWGLQVWSMIDKGNGTTFHGALSVTQSNGEWVPMHVMTRFGKELTMNGRQKLDPTQQNPTRFGADKNTEWSPDMLAEGTLERSTPQAVEVMEYAILWVDRRNAPDMPATGPDGKPMHEQIVNVQSTISPEMIEAIRGTGSGGTDARLIDAIYSQGARLGQLADGVKALADKPPAVLERRKPGPKPKYRGPSDGSGS